MIKEFGYEYDTVPDEALWDITKGKTASGKYNGALVLRSGRDALKVIAREFESATVLLPALSCDSMILPFEMYAHKVEFYKYNTDYSVNIESVNSIIDAHKNETVLFLYMDYIGNRSLEDGDLETLKKTYPKLIFIEDRTHNLLIESTRSFLPDYTMASLRKWADIPDGGLLWTSGELKYTEFSDDVSFCEKRLKAQCMRREFFHTGNEETKLKYRQIFSTVCDIMDSDKMPAKMSAYSFERAKKIDWNLIRTKRKNNAEVLINEFKKANIHLVQDKAGTGDVYVEILIENRDEIQRKLSSVGIFCTVIWPLNDRQRAACKTAEYTERKMLAVYCDQRYSEEDMKYVASNIVRFVNE